jgi:hypothetical protein
MFNAAIETIRRNPRATIGIAAVVLTAFLAIPAIATIVWGGIAGFGSQITSSADSGNSSPQDVGLLLSLLGGGILSFLATIVLTGMTVHVVERAARGQKLSAGEAWGLTRGRVWRLLGLALLTGLLPVVPAVVIVLLIVAAATVSTGAAILVGVVAGLGGLAGTVYLWVRLLALAPAALVIERIGVFGSMGRSWTLTRGAFWRTFGISLLSYLVAAVAAQFLSLPFGILGVVAGLLWPNQFASILVLLLSQNVAQVVAGSLTTPFKASMTGLLYLDQRIRKEGYDIQLISEYAAAIGPR